MMSRPSTSRGSLPTVRGAMGFGRWFRLGAGLILLLGALSPWRGDPEPNGPPWEADERRTTAASRGAAAPAPPRRRVWRAAGRILTAIVVLLLVGFLVWLRPFEAGPGALDALHSDGNVSVVDTATTIELAPVGTAPPTVGLVFSPGARVDSRAYAA